MLGWTYVCRAVFKTVGGCLCVCLFVCLQVIHSLVFVVSGGIGVRVRKNLDCEYEDSLGLRDD